MSEYLAILDAVIEEYDGSRSPEQAAHARRARFVLEKATDSLWAEMEQAEVSPSTFAMQMTADGCSATCGARR